MRKFADWYDGLSPTGHLVLQVAVTLSLALLSAAAHQRIGFRRGYREGRTTGLKEGYDTGYAAGTSPLKQSQLDQAHMDGWKMGCSDGVRYSRPTVISQNPPGIYVDA